MKQHSSKFKGQTKTGPVKEIVRHYDGRGHAAYRAGEIPLAHEYWQHSEHWRKVNA